MPDLDMFSYVLGLKKVLRILWVKRSKYSEHKDQDMRQVAAYKRVLTTENFNTVSKKWLPSLASGDRLREVPGFRRFDGKNCGVLGCWSLIVAGRVQSHPKVWHCQINLWLIAIPLPPGGGLRPENSVGGVTYPDPSFRPRARDI